jgi:hypothetical protein
MIVFRSKVDVAYCFELAAYTNDRKGGWVVSDPVIVCADERAEFYGKRDGSLMRYLIIGPNGERIEAAHRWKRPWVSSAINTWFGGANNSEGPFGGEAHRDMSVWIYARNY